MPDELTVWQCRPELVSARQHTRVSLTQHGVCCALLWIYLQSIDSVPFLIVVVHQIHGGLCKAETVAELSYAYGYNLSAWQRNPNRLHCMLATASA